MKSRRSTSETGGSELLLLAVGDNPAVVWVVHIVC